MNIYGAAFYLGRKAPYRFKKLFTGKHISAILYKQDKQVEFLDCKKKLLVAGKNCMLILKRNMVLINSPS